jgi:RsiW-degrading membrane proteinase PrsW (M82 family)
MNTHTHTWKRTSNILAIINATVNGAKGAASYNTFDDELGGVNLPFLSCYGGTVIVIGESWGFFNIPFSFMISIFLVFVFFHSTCPTQMPLQLLVQALEIYLICSHIPTIALTLLVLHLSLLFLELDRPKENFEVRAGANRDRDKP